MVELAQPKLAPELRSIPAVLRWLAVLSIALGVLAGRYSWAPDVRGNSVVAYLSSAYMLVITLPTLYYLLRLFIHNTVFPRACTVAVALVLVLPYHWLGLERWYYNASRPAAYGASTVPHPAPDWLPQAFQSLRSMPHEAAFFGSLLALGLIITLWWLKPWSTSVDRGPTSAKRVSLWLGLFLLIVFETWLHLSLRSPYAYITHFEQPAEANYWYVQYLFPEGMGAVNADYNSDFRPIDDLFTSGTRPTNTTMINRSYPHYISTQLSYFVSPYYVYLILNVGLWLLACVSTYRLTAALWNRQVATFATFMTGTGSGFIMFVAEPMSYLAGYSIIVMLFMLAEEVLVAKCRPTAIDYLAFGTALGLASLVYEIFPIYPCLILFVLIRRGAWKGLIASLVLGLVIYNGFLFLQGSVLGVDLQSQHSSYNEASWESVGRVFMHPHFSELYTLSVLALRTYFGSLVNAFFILPALVGLVGAFVIRDRDRAMILLTLGLPSALAVLFLQFGRVQWGNGQEMFYIAALPRFVYIAYPAIYILAAVALQELKGYIASLSSRRLFVYAGHAAPWLVLLLFFLISNVDVLGFPQPYYLFYYPSGGKW